MRSCLCDRLRLSTLLDQARVLSVGVLFDKSRVRLVAIVPDWHIIHDLRRAVLVLNAPSADMATIGERLLCIEM